MKRFLVAFLVTTALLFVGCSSPNVQDSPIVDVSPLPTGDDSAHLRARPCAAERRVLLPSNVHHDRLREGGKGPNIGSLVMRNQGFADREASVGNRPVDTSRWATSPILVWVSRAARRRWSKAVIASS